MKAGWLEQFHKRMAAEPKTASEVPQGTEAPGEVSRRTSSTAVW